MPDVAGPTMEEKIRSITSFLDEIEHAHVPAPSDFDAVRSYRQRSATTVAQRGVGGEGAGNGAGTGRPPAAGRDGGGGVGRDTGARGKRTERAYPPSPAAAGASEVLHRDLDVQSAAVDRLLQARAEQHGASAIAMRAEYEATIARHLAFIDTLIGDKKALAGKCEHLVGELQALDSSFATKMKAMEERYRIELKKQKEVRHGMEERVLRSVTLCTRRGCYGV